MTAQNTGNRDEAPFHDRTNPLPLKSSVCTIKSVRKHFRMFKRISKKYTQDLKYLPGRGVPSLLVRNVCGSDLSPATTRPLPGSPGHDVALCWHLSHQSTERRRGLGPRRGGQTWCCPDQEGAREGPIHPAALPINHRAALCESVPLEKFSGKRVQNQEENRGS